MNINIQGLQDVIYVGFSYNEGSYEKLPDLKVTFRGRNNLNVRDEVDYSVDVNGYVISGRGNIYNISNFNDVTEIDILCTPLDFTSRVVCRKDKLKNLISLDIKSDTIPVSTDLNCSENSYKFTCRYLNAWSPNITWHILPDALYIRSISKNAPKMDLLIGGNCRMVGAPQETDPSIKYHKIITGDIGEFRYVNIGSFYLQSTKEYEDMIYNVALNKQSQAVTKSINLQFSYIPDLKCGDDVSVSYPDKSGSEIMRVMNRVINMQGMEVTCDINLCKF